MDKNIRKGLEGQEESQKKEIHISLLKKMK